MRTTLSYQGAQHIKDTGFDMDRILKLRESHCLPCLDFICVRTSVHYRSHTVAFIHMRVLLCTVRAVKVVDKVENPLHCNQIACNVSKVNGYSCLMFSAS